MERKINKVGKNTLTVSLPASWVRESNITAEDKLTVTIEKDRLIFSKELKKSSKSLTLHLDKSSYNSKIIIQAYKKGFDEIKIFTTSATVIKDITHVLGVMVGFEIIEQTSDYILCKNIAIKLDDDISKLMNRNIYITMELIETMIDALEQENESLLDNIIEAEHINNRLCLLSERILIKNGYLDNYSSTPFAMVFFYKMENVADNFKLIASYLKDHNTCISEFELLNICREISEYKNLFIDVFLQKKDIKWELIESNRKELINKINTISTKKANISIVLTHLSHVVNDLYDLCGISIAMKL